MTPPVLLCSIPGCGRPAILSITVTWVATGRTGNVAFCFKDLPHTVKVNAALGDVDWGTGDQDGPTIYRATR